MSSGKGDRGWSAVVSGGESKETAHGDQAKSTADAKGQSKLRTTAEDSAGEIEKEEDAEPQPLLETVSKRREHAFQTDPITGAIYRSMSSRKMRSLARSIQHRAEQDAGYIESEASRIQIRNALLLASPDYNADTTPLLTPTTSVASRSSSVSSFHSAQEENSPPSESKSGSRPKPPLPQNDSLHPVLPSRPPSAVSSSFTLSMLPSWSETSVPVVSNATPQPSSASRIKSPDRLLEAQILQQMEFYFSDDNLVSDEHLRSLMNKKGYVRLREMVKFHRIRRFSASLDVVASSVKSSKTLDLKGFMVRRVKGWRSFLPQKLKGPKEVPSGAKEVPLSKGESPKQ